MTLLKLANNSERSAVEYAENKVQSQVTVKPVRFYDDCDLPLH